MIEQTIKDMNECVLKLQNMIEQDLEDVKKANHKKLSDRNVEKQDYMEKIINYKKELNAEIIKLLKANSDVNQYRQSIDDLEFQLKKLFDLNRKLGQIVLPIRDMYKNIVDEITSNTGGNIIEIKA